MAFDREVLKFMLKEISMKLFMKDAEEEVKAEEKCTERVLCIYIQL